METPRSFHYLVRGILIQEAKVLVAREIGASNSFLPGGHIELGERAEAALVREIEEELGLRPTVGRFLGAVEHVWPEGSRDNHEINLLFEIQIEGISSASPPASLESHLEFLWVERDLLPDVNLLPPALIELLRCEADQFEAFWASMPDASK